MGQLEWNDNNVKLVAIDGQHRLSALKRSMRDKIDTLKEVGPFQRLFLRFVE